MDLKKLFNALPGNVYWKDINGIYLGCNEYMARNAGLASPADIIGKTDFDLPWKEHADDLRIIDDEIIKSGIAQVIEEEEKLANGQLVTFITAKKPLRDEK